MTKQDAATRGAPSHARTRDYGRGMPLPYRYAGAAGPQGGSETRLYMGRRQPAMQATM